MLLKEDSQTTRLVIEYVTYGCFQIEFRVSYLSVVVTSVLLSRYRNGGWVSSLVKDQWFKVTFG